MREKIEACFSRLQDLDIKSTLGNMENLIQTLYDLREMYEKLGGEDNADPCGRNNH